MRDHLEIDFDRLWVSVFAGDPGLARSLGASGHAVYREQASEEALGRRWRATLEQLA